MSKKLWVVDFRTENSAGRVTLAASGPIDAKLKALDTLADRLGCLIEGAREKPESEWTPLDRRIYEGSTHV